MKNLYYFAIEYSIFSVIIAFFLAKAVKDVRDKKNKNNVVTFIFLSIVFIFMIWQACEVYKAIYRPVVRQYQGIYIGKSKSRLKFYDLKNEDEEKSFYIAWLAMGKNGDLRKNEKYKVYYEKNTEIIVKIRKIS